MVAVERVRREPLGGDHERAERRAAAALVDDAQTDDRARVRELELERLVPHRAAADGRRRLRLPPRAARADLDGARALVAPGWRRGAAVRGVRRRRRAREPPRADDADDEAVRPRRGRASAGARAPGAAEGLALGEAPRDGVDVQLAVVELEVEVDALDVDAVDADRRERRARRGVARAARGVEARAPAVVRRGLGRPEAAAEDVAGDAWQRRDEAERQDERERGLCGNQIFKPTSMCAYAIVLTRALRLCFENSTTAIDSSKNQPNRLRIDRVGEL